MTQNYAVLPETPVIFNLKVSSSLWSFRICQSAMCCCDWKLHPAAHVVTSLDLCAFRGV